MPRVSTAGVSTDRYTPVPTGTYRLIVETAESTTSKAGNPAFKMAFKIASPESIGDMEVLGKTVYYQGSLQTHALFGLKRALKALGVDNDILEDKKGFDTDEIFPEIIGREADAQITLQPREDIPTKMGNDVQFIIPGEKSGW